MSLLDESEALELIEFDPVWSRKALGNPRSQLLPFCRSNSTDPSQRRRGAIVNDFPKPGCSPQAGQAGQAAPEEEG